MGDVIRAVMKVRDVIRWLEGEGWFLVATRGSHRQYKHPVRPGRVTVAGKPSDDLALGTLNSILKAVRSEGSALMRYAVVIEKADGNYSAYVPDLPGCVATGDTVAAVESEIREAIRFHVDGLQADGIVVPQPTSIAEYIET
jgi:predicted RNA binding protein YcfA (HicA-like mRNA interferase family)/predicted RNase H-like HicB family nuclease